MPKTRAITPVTSRRRHVKKKTPEQQCVSHRQTLQQQNMCSPSLVAALDKLEVDYGRAIIIRCQQSASQRTELVDRGEVGFRLDIHPVEYSKILLNTL